MSLVGKKILFKNKKVTEPTWGKVLDAVLVSDFNNSSTGTKYLIEAVVTLKQSKILTSDETMIFLVKPKHIQLVENG